MTFRRIFPAFLPLPGRRGFEKFPGGGPGDGPADPGGCGKLPGGACQPKWRKWFTGAPAIGRLYTKRPRVFRTTLEPYLVPAEAPAPVRRLVQAANPAGVGPMAAVAGVFAELAGRFLAKPVPGSHGGKWRRYLFVEHETPPGGGSGGRFSLQPPDCPGSSFPVNSCGICTSSRSVGPSLAWAMRCRRDPGGKCPLADAVATAAANRVQSKEDVQKAVDFAAAIAGVLGVLVILDDTLGVWGQVKLLLLRIPKQGGIKTC
jgi:uncharacterized protein